jgi:hypothetical protein
LKLRSCILEARSRSEESADDEDEQGEEETSIGREPEQPTDSQTESPPSGIAFVKAKLKSVLILFLVYGKWILDKLIGFLNELSKDYRAVARQLKKARREKRSRDMLASESMDDDSVDAKVGCAGWSNLCSKAPRD